MIASGIIALMLAGLILLYLHDRRQTAHTILRNFPVVGYFRYFAETLGEYMRQYQYLPDWAERPFNRLERAWVYRSAKGVSNLRQLRVARTCRPSCSATPPSRCWTRRSDPIPASRSALAEGPGACRSRISPSSFFNICGMSYGALSHAAVIALSRGAKLAGIWMATGEGGLAPYHLEGGCDVIMQMGTAKYGVRDAQGNLSEDRLREIAAHPPGAHVRGQAGARCEARQRRHPAGRQGHRRRSPRIRGIPEGQDSISPNRHRDIGNVARARAASSTGCAASPASRSG